MENTSSDYSSSMPASPHAGGDTRTTMPKLVAKTMTTETQALSKVAQPVQAAIVLLEKLNGISEDMTIKQARVFCCVASHNGPCTLEDINKDLRTSTGVVTKYVQKLVAMGLLRKEYAPGREREKVIELTNKGTDLARLIGALIRG